MSNIGSPYRPIRDAVVKKDGTTVVEVVGQEDFRAYINSFKDQCDVQLLVERAMNGEPEVLNQRQGMYGDFTQMPKTFAEVCQKVIDAHNLFDSLSPDKRAIFDNDISKFIAAADQPDFAEKLGWIQKKEEVKENVE